MEVGPRDMAARQCRIVRRDDGEKRDIGVDTISEEIPKLLDEIHFALFNKAKQGRDEKIVKVTKWNDFVPALERQCMVLTPFCDLPEWEDKVKVNYFGNTFNPH